MYVKKRTSPVLAVLLVIVAVLAALVILMSQYLVVDFHLYPRNARHLDLRGEDVSFRHYEKVASSLPDCEILWDVPFQDGLIASNTEKLSVASLGEEDLKALSYLKDLKILDARQCKDYGILQTLQEQMPGVEVDYRVTLGGEDYDPEQTTIILDRIEAEEIASLPYLKNLEAVTVTGEGDCANFGALQAYCRENGILFSLVIGGEPVPDDTQALTALGITNGELNLLSLMPELKQLHLSSPKASAELVISLDVAHPDMDITWDMTLGDITLTQETVDVDLSSVTVTDLETVENVLRYFPNVETVFMGEQDIDHETMAAFRSRVREEYKVVWYIRMGDSKPIRTDITYFMPGRDGPVFNDTTSYNIRYCEDLVAVDVGHLGVHDVSWVGYLTNLEYLILSHTGISYIDGVENCKKLKFLEMTDCGALKDLAPLKGCTALEDLNFGNSWPDVSALKEMPWLKNIYMIFGSGSKAYELSQALPDTRVVTSGDYTVASGWRKLPNYYAMRDALHAYYMN